MLHLQQEPHQKNRWTLWIGCISIGLGISLMLFGIMPCLIEKEPPRPRIDKCISFVDVIRIKRHKKEIKEDKERPKARPKKNIKLLASKAIYVTPGIKIKQKLELPFSINPKLPALSSDIPVQPVTSVRLSSLGIKGAFAIGEVDFPPMPIVQVPPVYPMSARMKGIEGWVVVRFIVDENGRTTHIHVIKSLPRGMFEDAVIRCVSKWRFKPATLEGIKVKTLVQTKICFKLK